MNNSDEQSLADRLTSQLAEETGVAHSDVHALMTRLGLADALHENANVSTDQLRLAIVPMHL